MKTVKIRLSSIEAVRNFVEIVRKFEGDIDLSSGRYIVDAKSIMGTGGGIFFSPAAYE